MPVSCTVSVTSRDCCRPELHVDLDKKECTQSSHTGMIRESVVCTRASTTHSGSHMILSWREGRGGEGEGRGGEGKEGGETANFD